MNYLIIDGHIQKEWKSLIVTETSQDVLYILTGKKSCNNIQCITTHDLRLHDFIQTYIVRVAAGVALNVTHQEDVKVYKALSTMKDLISLHKYNPIRLTLIKD